MLDLAVAVIIGVAFNAVVDSLVKDLIMPTIGMLGGAPDFSALKIGPIAIGNFLNAVIAFLIKAAGLYFFLIVPYNRFAKKTPPAPRRRLLPRSTSRRSATCSARRPV